MKREKRGGQLGNKGGGRKGFGQENKINELKGLCLDFALRVMKGEEEVTIQEKIKITEKILNRIVPNEIEVTGKEGGPIEMITKMEKELRSWANNK